MLKDAMLLKVDYSTGAPKLCAVCVAWYATP